MIGRNYAHVLKLVGSVPVIPSPPSPRWATSMNGELAEAYMLSSKNMMIQTKMKARTRKRANHWLVLGLLILIWSQGTSHPNDPRYLEGLSQGWSFLRTVFLCWFKQLYTVLSIRHERDIVIYYINTEAKAIP